MPLGAITDAELDAEVDTEPDEQHRERHGNKIERAVHQQTEGRGHHHAREQTEQNGDDEATGADRQPQQNHDDEHRHDTVECRAFRERRELLVGKRHGSGETDTKAGIAGEAEVAYRGTNRRNCACAGLERAEVEGRLHENVATQLARVGSACHDQRAPRKARHLSGVGRFDRFGECDQRPSEVVEFDLFTAHAFEYEGQCVHDAAQRRIGR